MKYSKVLSVVFTFVFVALVSSERDSFVVQKPANTLCKLLFKDCGSKQGSLESVSFNGTCSEGKAILKKGTSVLIDFTFTANVEEDNLKSVVHGKIGEIPAWVPFPMGNPDACKDSGLTCPVPAKSKEDFTPILAVLSSYPSVNVYVKWELQDKNGDDVFCAIIPATITS